MIFVFAALCLAGLAAWAFWSSLQAVRDIDGVFGEEEDE